jgi:hypothetical protein
MPNTEYNCSVAAYTIVRGPFSEPIIILLHQENQTIASQTNTRNARNACMQGYYYNKMLLIPIPGG